MITRADCVDAVLLVQSVPRGLKPQILRNFCGAAKQAAERLAILGKTGRERSSVAEARVASVRFMRGLPPASLPFESFRRL